MLLEANNVSKWFDNVGTQTVVLKDINFFVDYGEMLFIVGPSGSGKTTLLSIISGMLRPNQGKVIYKKNNIWDFHEDQLANFRLNSVGFVFQNFYLFPKVSAKENVAIPLLLQKVSWKDAIYEAERLLSIFDLENKIDVITNRLSIGEQQRVAIARALITKPEMLIFDEPTASLDGMKGKQIISFIKDSILNKQHAIIVVTHDTRIYEFATRIIHLEDGKLIQQTGHAHDD